MSELPFLSSSGILGVTSKVSKQHAREEHEIAFCKTGSWSVP